MRSTVSGFVLLIASLMTLAYWGCSQENAPKKISFSETTSDALENLRTRKREETEKNTLNFGFDLRLGPKEDVRIYTPFIKYLEKLTGRRFRIKFTEKYEDTVDNLGNGITHFAAIGSLSYVIGRETYEIKCLASGLNNKGLPSYQSMIFTRPGSDIQNLEDIRGKNFAFGSRMSTQGHLIPRKMLEDAGIRLYDLSYYVYTGSHTNTVRAVLNGDFDAGGIQDSLARRLEAEGKIRIIRESKQYPSSLICYNPALDTGIIQAVRHALMSFEPRGKHKDMFVDWDKTEMPLGFAAVDKTALDEVAALALKYGLIRK